MEENNTTGKGMTIGVDLGGKWSQFYVLDEHGAVCEEGRIATTHGSVGPLVGTIHTKV